VFWKKVAQINSRGAEGRNQRKSGGREPMGVGGVLGVKVSIIIGEERRRGLFMVL